MRTYVHMYVQLYTYIRMLGTNVRTLLDYAVHKHVICYKTRRLFHASVEPETGCPFTHN